MLTSRDPKYPGLLARIDILDQYLDRLEEWQLTFADLAGELDALRLFAKEQGLTRPAMPCAETEDEPDVASVVIDLIQVGLDLGGIIEPTPFCDLGSAGISLCRGEWGSACLSLCGVIPYVGDVPKIAGKIKGWVAKVLNAIKVAAKSKRGRQLLTPLLKELRETLKELLLHTPECLKKPFEKMLKAIEEFLSSKYVDITKGRRSVRNIATNATRKEFEETLIREGWRRTVSKDGKVVIYEKNGAKYTVRDYSKSMGDKPTAEYFRPGSKTADIENRLEK